MSRRGQPRQRGFGRGYGSSSYGSGSRDYDDRNHDNQHQYNRFDDFHRGGRSRGSPSHQKRSQQRGLERRNELAKNFQVSRDEKIKETLFAGLTESDLTKRIGEGSNKVPIPLSVSTRGVGFGTQTLCYVVSRYKATINIPDINSLYRAFLGIVETKLQELRFSESIEDVEVKRGPGLSFDYVRIANSVARLPEPINRIVASIGMVMHNEESFMPVMHKDVVDAQGRFVPISTNVVLSNLRRTVVALSEAATSGDYRERFRRQNPIPGTRWSADNLLLNPNEIIAENYNVNSFSEDIMAIIPFVSQIENYVPKMRGGSNTTMENQGRKSLFVSNLSESLKQPELDAGDRMAALTKLYSKIPEGEIDLFWSRVHLDVSDRVEGIITLLGEIPTLTSIVHPLSTNRTAQACPHRIMYSYKPSICVCFGI